MKYLLILFAFLSFTADAQIVCGTGNYDIYCGLNTITSPNTQQNGWRTEKFGNQWWYVDPLNHPYHFVAPYNIGLTNQAANFTKYGVNSSNWPCTYLPSVVQRLQSWNFTGIGGGSVVQMWPYGNYSCWPSSLGSNYPTAANRMPIVLYFQTSLNAMANRIQSNRVATTITQAPKMHEYGLSYYGWAPYVSSVGTADYADSRLYSYFDWALTNRDDNLTYFTAPPSLQLFTMGYLTDEADEMGFFTTGGDKCGETSVLNTDGTANGLCSGKEHTHGGLISLVMSPLQYANRMKGQMYTDPKVYDKAVTVRSYLKTTYGTVAALNTAWGTTYSACDMEGLGDQFGSCGTQQTAEAYGTGNGGTSAYAHTLAHLTPSMHSIALFVGGALVAGDLGCNLFEADILCAGVPLSGNTSKFWGPLVNDTSSTINYTTGAASVTFRTGSISVFSLSSNGTTWTVRVGSQSLSGPSAHGTWPGAHVTISGTTNYNVTGAVVASVVDEQTFTITHAGSFATELGDGTASFTDTSPGSGIPITISYVQNGWGLGNGVMDEDGRHATWMGSANDEVNGVNLYLAPNSTIRTDLNNILGQLAQSYFSGMDAKFTLHFGPKGPTRTVLNLGPDPLIYWASPSRAGVLQAAGQYLDVIGMQSYKYQIPMTQARLDWIRTNAGDIPIQNVDFITANPDSSERTHTGNTDFDHYSTQAARATAYYNYVNQLSNMTYTVGGDKPYVGSQFWTWFDSDAEQTNYGLLTTLDNGYNGVEDVTGTVTCSAPNAAFSCGGEPSTSGNFLTGTHSVTTGNAMWLTAPTGTVTQGITTGISAKGVIIQ